MTANWSSAVQNISQGFRQSVELIEFPSVTLNRLSWAFLNNDWMTVISSVITLTATTASVLVNISK